MPLREGLLAPIPGPNPSGANLRHDPLMDQLNEARREDDDSLPTGEWGRAAKKADHRLAVKLASDALVKRTKDLRITCMLVDSIFRLEGLPVLGPSLQLLREIQESFWPTLYPELEEGGDSELRQIELVRVARWLRATVLELPVTVNGTTLAKYDEARTVGYEKAADTDSKAQTRKQAIAAGKLTAEDFDKHFKATPKTFYVETQAELELCAALAEQLDLYQRDAFGKMYANLTPLTSAIRDVAECIGQLLDRRRETEPDAVDTLKTIDDWNAKGDEPVFAVDAPAATVPQVAVAPAAVHAAAPVAPAVPSPAPAAAAVTTLREPADAYRQIVRAAQFLQKNDANSPVPYLVCAGLYLGETRLQGSSPADGFAVAPGGEIRQALRAHLQAGAWSELLAAALPVLGEPCARAWLDLQWYIWQAADQFGASALAAAVCDTLRGLLAVRPEVREWMLEDGTAAANPQTLRWLDEQQIMPAAKPIESAAPAAPEPPAPPPALPVESGADERVYEAALALVQGGRTGEAIAAMAHEAEAQATGRMRFRRRLQLAQICLAAQNAQIARPLLEDLVAEIDRRSLSTWESGELLGSPVSLLLGCLNGSGDDELRRTALFQRLCLLDPRGAAAART